MTKKNTYKPRNAGSGLVVVIMITSVMLVLAIVLLQRIIPYSREIRDMQEATQAFYGANSQIEIALNSTMASIANKQVTMPASGIMEIDYPFSTPIAGSIAIMGTFAVLDRAESAPFSFKLFPQDLDTDLVKIGTSKTVKAKHTLYPYQGLSFELTGVDTNTVALNIQTERKVKLEIEFIHQIGGTLTTFFGSIETIKQADKNLFDTIDNNDPGKRLSNFLSSRNCNSGAYCSIKISTVSELDPIIAPPLPVDFKLSATGEMMGDLSTVIVADGLSETGEYHSRIIEIKEKNQGI